jgi:hypothetical protein
MTGNNIVREPKLLLDAVSAAGPSGNVTANPNNSRQPVITGQVIAADHRFKEVNERCYIGTLTSGDSITIEAKFRPGDTTWYAIESITDTAFAGVLRGPWPFIRVNKVGTNGVATFDIMG